MKFYEQLTKDLEIAKKEAIAVAAMTDDGGTCNFDSLMLSLPRKQHAKVFDAVKKAGLRAWYSEFWKSFIISTPVFAQGNRRTAQAEKMRDFMESVGYDASVYYQMD